MTTQKIEHRIQPDERDNFSRAEFALYLPENMTKTDHILCLIPGINEDGTQWLSDEVWTAFAEKYKIPIFASYFQVVEGFELEKILDGLEPKVRYYAVTKGGSGNAFLEALEACISKTKRPQLSSSRLLLFGYSAGGIFSHNFSIDYPQKVAAFVVNKGGAAYVRGSQDFFSIPGLFFLGENDKIFRKNSIQSAYNEGASQGAPWLLIRESGIGHGFGKSIELSLEFFKGIISKE